MLHDQLESKIRDLQVYIPDDLNGIRDENGQVLSEPEITRRFNEKMPKDISRMINEKMNSDNPGVYNQQLKENIRIIESTDNTRNFIDRIFNSKICPICLKPKTSRYCII